MLWAAVWRQNTDFEANDVTRWARDYARCDPEPVISNLDPPGLVQMKFVKGNFDISAAHMLALRQSEEYTACADFGVVEYRFSPFPLMSRQTSIGLKCTRTT